MTPLPLKGTTFVPTIPDQFLSILDKEVFFSRKEILRLIELERAEHPELGRPGKSCKVNLFFGFFFDGTKKNFWILNATKITPM